MEILDNFSYLNELLLCIVEGRPFSIGGTPVYEVNMTGPRKSSKSNSVEQFILKSLALKRRVNAVIVRKEATQIVDTFNEYNDTYNEIFNYYPIKRNQTFKTLTYWNKNKARFLSINKSKKSHSARSDVGVGLSKLSCDYAILHFEEAHQFLNDEIRAVEEALRGYKYLVIIRTSNPWSINNDFIKYCNMNLKYNPSILTDALGSEQTLLKKNKIFHYSRFENNPFNTMIEVERLNELKTLDPKRARIAVYGLPGISDGGIYTDYLSSIKYYQPKDFKPNSFYGGIDWGETKSSTVAQLWGADYNLRRIVGLDSYEHNNQKSPYSKTSKQMGEEIVEFYAKQFQLYPTLYYTGLEVAVDYSAFGVIDLLQLLANKRGLKIEFVPSQKYPIQIRIDIITAVISLGNFYVDKIKMSNLLTEMDLSIWDPDHTEKQLPIRLKIDDHQLDAMEYALAPILYDLIEGYDIWLRKKGYN